jgi:hypothetical protein
VLFDHAAARIDADDCRERLAARNLLEPQGAAGKSHIAPSHRGDAAGRGLKRDGIRR